MSQTRMTRQRMIILNELRSCHTHPTAEDIHDRVRAHLPSISLGTVYRNLELLARSGQAVMLEHAGSRLRFDGNTMPHRHVRCAVCGRVADVEGLPADMPPPEGASAGGFSILSMRVEYVGLCDECGSSAHDL